MEVLGKLMAGVGIFFSGLYFLNTALKQLTSRRIRIMLAKWTRSLWQGCFIGTLLGAAIQSTTALSFILAGLVSASMIQLTQAIPVILWSNPGCCLLVVVAFLDINTVILFVLGIAGFCYAYEKPARLPTLSQAFFGLGLLFFGLNMIKTGALPLSKMGWFQTLLLQGQHALWLNFVMGALLTMLVQSSVTIMILAIAFTQSGVLSVDQTIMIIYGANFGSSVLTWLLSVNLKGTAKQIVIAQIWVNIVGSLFMVILFCVEAYAGIPLVKALAAQTSSQVEQQMTAICILFNLSAAIILTIMKGPFSRFLVWCSPPTQQEEWSKAKYLHDQMLNNPETALELIQKEQSRLFMRFPLYIEEARKNLSVEKSSLLLFHQAFKSVSHEIDTFLSEILKSCSIHSTIERALRAQTRQDLIGVFEQTSFDLIQMLLAWTANESDRHLKAAFIEGVDFLILTARDAFENPAVENIDLVLRVTEDRSELMQALRKRILSSNLELSSTDRMTFQQITSLYERMTWILGRIGSSLQQEKNME